LEAIVVREFSYGAANKGLLSPLSSLAWKISKVVNDFQSGGGFMVDDNKFPHLAALHEKYARHDLRAMWQRDRAAAPELEAHIWRWAEIWPILQETLRTVRLPEDTDQRVIGLNPPGISSRAVYCSYQMINPGEKIPSHRHTPAQMRFIVKGSGAYTTSQGEAMSMEPGDLLVQPNWTWHGTTDPGNEPVFWVDIQDRNLVNYLGAFRRDLWPNDDVEPTVHPENYYAKTTGLIRPATSTDNAAILPPIHYKWRDMVKVLDEVTETAELSPYDGRLFEYRHPSTGGYTLPTLSAQLQLLPPQAKTKEHRHTGMTMYLVVQGEGATMVNGETLEWHEHDCFMLPPWQWHAHNNLANNDRAILLTVSDRPALEALGLYYEEGR
jgi:gentisate 1,2-dioxygenase